MISSLGAWNINVVTGGMPEKVATAFGKLNELVGAEYEPIAYLGSQLVNGTNHAVLAKQTIVAGKDTENIVLVIFHETKDEVVMTSIERVVEGNAQPGGIFIEDNPLEIPAEAKVAFEKTVKDFVGSAIEPFALLAEQVTEGTNYIFAAEVIPTTADPVKKVATVAVNALNNTILFDGIL